MLRGKTPIIIAGVLGVLAFLLYYYDRKMYADELKETWQPQKVLVAAAKLDPGMTLDSEFITEADMPAKFVYDSVLQPDNREVAIGREIIVPIKEGEPIHWYQLRGIRSLERLAKSVRRQSRAVTIDVSERSAVGHWVRPNDSVDVLGTFRDPRSNEMVTVSLLQAVLVLATGQTMASTQGIRADIGYNTVTVLVTPGQAEMLTLAQDLGTLNLVLRNPNDQQPDEEEGEGKTTIETLLSSARRIEREKPRRKRKAQIIRGLRDKGKKGGQ